MRRTIFPIFIAIVSAACGPNEAILKSSRNTVVEPAAALSPRKTTFEQDLADMRDAGFEYIFVIRRKDGKEFEDDDRKFLRESMPHEINRRVSSDDGKAFIFGSGFAIDIKSIEKWRTRYNVEDLSPTTEKVESQK